MTPAKDSDMNSPADSPTPCQQRMEPVLAELRDALLAAEQLPATVSADDREAADAEVCLTNRSSYLDYFTWVAINGKGDLPAEQELDDLFQRSLAVMTTKDLIESVEERYEEFKDLCARTQGKKTSVKELSSFME